MPDASHIDCISYVNTHPSYTRWTTKKKQTRGTQHIWFWKPKSLRNIEWIISRKHSTRAREREMASPTQQQQQRRPNINGNSEIFVLQFKYTHTHIHSHIHFFAAIRLWFCVHVPTRALAFFSLSLSFVSIYAKLIYEISKVICSREMNSKICFSRFYSLFSSSSLLLLLLSSIWAANERYVCVLY